MKWMLTCQDTTELLSDSLSKSLDWNKKIALKIHLFMCKICSEYGKQLQLLRQLASSLTDPSETSDFQSLSESVTSQIKESFEKINGV